MGGGPGGVMRTATKAAFLGGYRSAGSVSRRPATATVASVETMSSANLRSSEVARSDASEVARSWEIDGWVLAGGKEEDFFDAIHPAPRLVFGPVPTLEEAKEATSDLKDAMEKAYLSSNSLEESGNNSHDLKSCESSEIVSAVPNHVVQAISMLQGSPQAQNVVASLVSDKKIWDAILNNEKVIQFCNSHQSPAFPSEEGSATGNVSDEESVKNYEDSDDSAFSGFVQDVKLKVSTIVTDISDLLKGFFVTSATSTDKASAQSYTDVLGGSIIGLVIAIVLVVLCKRGV